MIDNIRVVKKFLADWEAKLAETDLNADRRDYDYADGAVGALKKVLIVMEYLDGEEKKVQTCWDAVHSLIAPDKLSSYADGKTADGIILALNTISRVMAE